jgi:hypothetical protein
MKGGDSRRAPASPVAYLRRRERSCETFPYVFEVILTVPVALSRYSGLSKVRPITIFEAPNELAERYLHDREVTDYGE